jgi:radical SAM superfamily enzyme YgiQ (UPF0313 family)
MPRIVFIVPRFEVSYWGQEYAMPFVGKRANMPTAAFPLLAALTPPDFEISIVDENVEAINYDDVAQADIVGITGMSVQRSQMRQILTELRSRGVFTVVGGPWVTVQEDYFGELADVIFIGEAEETWPRFLSDWKQGKHQTRYEQEQKSDMTKVPVPRFELLKMHHYLYGNIQFSRGCPFQCEFCDIIVTFGRRPRMKTSQQVLAELEALRARGMTTAFIVDDNLIGNKKAIKELLRELIDYQNANGFPFRFFTEASLDLAEDAELMRLMVDANITGVFIGIESPNEKALKETKKFQNVRPVGTLLERVRRIQDAGMEVTCGMIVGFDNDDADIFEAQRRFIQDARIIHAMLGMLTAIPKTPLHERLAREGRLDPADVNEFGTNIIPVQMTREELREGFVRVFHALNEPKAYFERVEALYLKGRLGWGKALTRYWRRHPLQALKKQIMNAVKAGVLFWRLMRDIPEEELKAEYRRRFLRILCSRPNPALVLHLLGKITSHYHAYTMARQMVSGGSAVVNSF